MSIELLFERRTVVGENILKIIRDKGYTKSSFAKAINITRPTLDRLLAGEIESLTKYRQYIENITQIQDITEDKLLNYVPKLSDKNEKVLVHSYNAPNNHEIKRPAKEMFSILDDILNICEIYYGK
jgi:transcriptional regulator with XRE-family HTH domain